LALGTRISETTNRAERLRFGGAFLLFGDSRMQLDGPKIRWLRENKGMTARDLCRVASISKGYLSQIESNSRGCSPNVAARIAGALGVPIVGLRGNDEAFVETVD
jgi:DNA-binding XRE family transcriptional regulator